MCIYMFFFDETASTCIYTYGHTLSLHDALPISTGRRREHGLHVGGVEDLHGQPQGRHHHDEHQGGSTALGGQGLDLTAHAGALPHRRGDLDRTSTRLNSSH